ncbi:NHL domain-containing protein [Taibaiella soli]|uniref:Uncharacterized protein n=1 Tax=Taibaiella soli TaxID=1649169 RepID=A0A2W2BCW2_9BACT|nr:T9SS type A sorting domain-containing protein [Taibaiella soli]PZF71496.1 hypothetical protein DN068_18185 [Taibaiella soli]
MNRRISLLIFLACSVLSYKPASAQIITTYAGSSAAGFVDNVQAKSAKINQPYGVALDANNNVYIADYNNNRVRKVDAATGIISTIAGNGTSSSTGDGGLATNATLKGPSGIVVDKFGNIYVSELGGNKVRKIATNGNISTFAGNSTPTFAGDGNLAVNASLNSPIGLATDTAGNIYIADELNNRIRMVNTTGYISTVAGNGPSGSGSYAGDGAVATSSTVRLNKPYGVAVAPNGDIYIADNGNCKIRKVDFATGIISTYAGVNTGGGSTGDGGAAASAKLLNPYGVSLDAAGNVYIADKGNNKIRKVDAVSGIITTIAGNGSNGFSSDSVSATTSKLSAPAGTVVDANGNIYIADLGNSRIREIVPFYPSVSIAASQNNVCSGTSITFTATPTNGGVVPSYQWMVNGASVGTNSATYTYVPANGDAVSCVLTSNNPYVNPITANSDTITMVLSTSLVPSATIAASQNNMCSGTQVVYTATAVNGGATPSYQWMVNGAPMGTNSTTFNYAPANGEMISCQLTSSLGCATQATVASDTVTANVVTSVVPSITITTPQNNICANTPVTFTAAITNGGTTPAYQWLVNGVNAGTSINTFNYTPADGDSISCILTSSAGCANPAVIASNGIVMTVNPVVNTAVSISASQNNICSGTQVTYTAIPTNGGTPSYQWMINGAAVGTNNASFTIAPANGNVVSCVMTSSIACVSQAAATSNNVTMNVTTSVVPQVNITPSLSSVCAGTSVLYTAIPSHGGSAPSYQWTVNGVSMGATGTNFSYIPSNGDVVNCIMTSNAACAIPAIDTSNNSVATVAAPTTPAVTVTPSQNTICLGSSVTYTATPTNGGGYPTYQWSVNGANIGPNTAVATFSYVPTNGDVVACTITSNAVCLTQATAVYNDTAVVNPILIANVNLTPSQNNICGSTPVNFTATPINGGTAPAYQWKVNGVSVNGSGNTYSFTPLNNDAVTCVMTSNALCADPGVVSATVDMVVNQPAVPVVTVSANPSSGAITGQPITFTVSTANAGTSPQYKWYRNNVLIAGATQSVYTALAGTDVANNDQIAATVTNTDPCGDTAISNKFTVAIVPSGVANINADNNSVSLYPNPNTGDFIVKGSLENKTQHAVTLEVFNTLGQSVYQETIQVSNGAFEHKISLTGNVSAGSYFLKLNGGNGSNMVRFVVGK